MFLQILTIIVPIFFVLLGYAAGRAKKFDSDQVAGINELVLDCALPASLFVGTVSASRTQLLQEAPLFLTMLICMVGLYVIVFLLGTLLFRHTLGVAALQTLVVNVTAAPFFGDSVLIPIYGAKSAVAISMIALIQNIVLVPTTLVLLGISQQPARSGPKPSTGSILGSALAGAIKTPIVWAPLLAVALVLVGVTVPSVVDSALGLIVKPQPALLCLSLDSLSLPAKLIRMTLAIYTHAADRCKAPPERRYRRRSPNRPETHG